MFKYRNVRHKISTIGYYSLHCTFYSRTSLVSLVLALARGPQWRCDHGSRLSTSLRLSQHTKGATLKKFTQEIQVDVQNEGRSLISAPPGAGRVVVHEKEHVHMTTKPTSSAESAPL